MKKANTMKITKLALCAFAILASSPSFAATDGTPDAVSSIGNFTNTFGSTIDRKVQVLDLKDAVMDAKTSLLLADNVLQFPGKRDDFCVVDNASGTVRIKFTNANGASSWVAKSILGTDLGYRVQFAPSTTGALTSIAVGGVVDFKSLITSASNCSTGNVSKGMTAAAASITTNVTFIDTVIVTVTPI